VIDEELSGHQRVEDAFPGWSGESNIYWNTELFSLLGYGTERIKEDEPEILRNRHLFWVRLAVKGQERTLFVATAHYTPASMPKEREDGHNPRLAEARKTIFALDRLLTADEACLFMGDLNDALLPIRILRASGLQDSFSASGAPPRQTHPAIPTGRGMLPQLLDWQLHRGPLRVMNTTVVDFFDADFAPSDHKPVSTTYAFV
jgi:endonuclease/exonuclease/phosphatase (EEP) superfamily protein YafD